MDTPVLMAGVAVFLPYRCSTVQYSTVQYSTHKIKYCNFGLLSVLPFDILPFKHIRHIVSLVLCRCIIHVYCALCSVYYPCNKNCVLKEYILCFMLVDININDYLR